ncbi:bifunctional DNA primase/polymerase [[Mycobacterium] burgundiense]|uniref:Bifunctional DNA primase/polymerase n=1 Tax=[Mycobacterium] burgundiense TaxID=3064286 RepID=A0ABM9LV39_9MYCO|nr:bifunctional DNA primase/polymerase [Mycolicibacterium sp. MU0053]CAJ1505253.1 bifunctional DNA primase/polymerase [Mycolicibacterium sp. MU0053]
MPLSPGLKTPTAKQWQLAAALTLADAQARLNKGGNIGVNLASSRMICLDAENATATAAVTAAGFTPTVIPAKAQDSASAKHGGSHTWLRVPDGIDAVTLPSDAMGITLPCGGIIDVLAGRRYAVAPPSRLHEAPGYFYAPAVGGPLDLASDGADIATAPMWLFDRAVPCPPGLEPLHGCLAPKTAYERIEADARSQDLSDRIDAVPWADWLDGDPRLVPTGQVDGCGCEIWHFAGADNIKSATLHENCEQGSGAHIWSGTMIGQLELDGDHLSRLDLSVALRGVSRREAAASVGIELGGGVEPLTPVRPEHYEQSAREAEAVGDTERAALFRRAAMALRSMMPDTGTAAGGEIHGASPIAGGVPATPRLTVLQGGDAAGGEDPEPVPEPEPAAKPKREIKRFQGLVFGEIPQPGEGEIHEYPLPPVPDHVPPVRGARTEFANVFPPLANRKSHETVKHEWVFSATPGLSQVAAAADSRGVSRFGMLAALLPRVAAHIPPTVRLAPAGAAAAELPAGPTGLGTSINLYSVLVGPPASGKSVTLAAADALVPDVQMVPVGTGEGILKLFPRAADDEDSDEYVPDGETRIANVGESRSCDSVLLSSDEIDVFVAEMGRQGTKASGLYRQMWMGGDVGNITSDRERHSMVAAHTYRFGIRLGAQPEAVTPMFDETGRGTPQRFLWIGAQRMPRRGAFYPPRLQVEPVYWFDGSPSMLPQTAGTRPVWVVAPPAAVDELLDEEWRSATANVAAADGGYGGLADADRAAAISERHALLQQLKICAVLAVLDGLPQPQDTHWFAAAAIMEVRCRMIFDLVEVAQAAAEEERRKSGNLRGIELAETDAKKRSVSSEMAAKAADKQLQMLQMRFGGKATRGKLGASNLTRSLRNFRDAGIRDLVLRGRVDVIGTGDSMEDVVILRSLNQHEQQAAAPPPPPAPTIGSIA